MADRPEPPAKSGQVSEVSGLADGPEPIQPQDATAGDPGDESGAAQEGTAGPDAPIRE
jgi:hypothetical protein